jgi:GT2 family glycosyltransferase
VSRSHYQIPPRVVDDTRKEAVFSISVPVKGGIEYLPLALASTALQSGLVQLALLDASGGDDRVRSLAEAYAPLIAYRYHRQADGGQSAAIQEGWDNTQGMFLGWLNSDDYLLPGALPQVKAVFDAHPEIDVVYGHGIYLNENGDFKYYFPAISRDLSSIYFHNIICQPACFIRRTALTRIGGLDLSLHYTMDWDLWIRLHKSGCKFHLIDEPLAIVHDHANSKTNSGSPERFREIHKHLRQHKSLKIRMKAAYYELLSKSTPVSLFVAGVIRKSASLISFSRQSSPLFGLEPYTNVIKDRCRITMTSLAEPSATHASLVVDCPGDYYIFDGKERRPMQLVGPEQVRTFGFPVKGVLYTAEISPVPAGRVDYIIESDSRSKRLLQFRLHHQ